MALTSILRTILTQQFRLLTFRGIQPNLREHANAYLAYGFVVTWLAGMGRYWDNPHATLPQYLGLGSITYVLLLAALLWLVVLPLRARNWTYTGVLVFVMFTSLPALLYAIPVERFMPLEQAQKANAWFLAIVATWRVALLVLFLRRAAGLGWFTIVVATLFPLTMIVVALAFLNLEHVVFNIMAGNDPARASANDMAYGIVFTLAVFSFMAFPVLGAIYAGLVWRARTRG